MTGTAVTFGTLDWAIVALYFVANTAICIWCALQKEKNTADYFLASRSAGWFLIGSSIFASNIGAEHLIGLAGSGAGCAEDGSISGMPSKHSHWRCWRWLPSSGSSVRSATGRGSPSRPETVETLGPGESLSIRFPGWFAGVDGPTAPVTGDA